MGETVAMFTERDAVRQVKAKFGVFCPMLAIGGV